MMTQLIKKSIALYCMLAIAFITLLCLSYCLPTDRIKKNVATSALQIEDEGVWWKPCGFYLYQIDNMTDCLMLGISSCDHEESILQAALLADHATPHSDDITDYYHKITSITYQDATGHHTIPYDYSNYARYWHGYQVILKPLLCIMGYRQIRVANCIALFLLAVLIGTLLYKKVGKYATGTFALALAVGNFFIVPLALQFSTCFYIAFIGMIVFLCEPRWLTLSQTAPTLVFFGIGACTSYFDFLTCPLLTLTFPLVVVLVSPRRKVSGKTFVLYGFSWGFGYASLWATKWVMASALTDFNIIDDAIQTAGFRMGNTLYFGGKEMSFARFFDMILCNIQAVVPMSVLCMVSLLLIVGIVELVRRNISLLKSERLLVCVALMPLVWFLMLKNHSVQHIFFTWRSWIVTLWCIFIIIYKKHQYINIKQ